MLSDADHIKELEVELERLNGDVERYRNACYDAMQQLGWCIGYFAGSHKPKYARAMANNLAYIRRAVLNRAPEEMPPAHAG
ncbi:MAG TPA: hypothetical protein VFH38_00540 [Jatrophihabitans sp.]|nr:hypothetical protein [Jatrophihabitans sp.]